MRRPFVGRPSLSTGPILDLPHAGVFGRGPGAPIPATGLSPLGRRACTNDNATCWVEGFYDDVLLNLTFEERGAVLPVPSDDVEFLRCPVSRAPSGGPPRGRIHTLEKRLGGPSSEALEVNGSGAGYQCVAGKTDRASDGGPTGLEGVVPTRVARREPEHDPRQFRGVRGRQHLQRVIHQPGDQPGRAELSGGPLVRSLWRRRLALNPGPGHQTRRFRTPAVAADREGRKRPEGGIAQIIGAPAVFPRRPLPHESIHAAPVMRRCAGPIFKKTYRGAECRGGPVVGSG